MLTKKLAKQNFIHFALLLGAVLLLLSACDSGNSNQNGSNAAPTSTTVNSASTIIRHSPSGTVELMWDHTSHVLTVHMALTGLTPKSTHPAHINKGSCKSGGKLVYDLSTIKSTQIGFADVITRIKDVTGGIPKTGWYIDVSNGPGMSPSVQGMPITCSNIFNPTVSTKLSQNVQATMINAYATNLLSNAGFESGSLSPWNGEIKPWLAGVETNYPHTGTHDAYLHPTSSRDVRLAQTITAPATRTYTLSAYAANNTGNVQFGADVNGTQVRNLKVTGNVGYHLYTTTFTATAGQSIKVWYYAHAINGWATIDDVSLT